ncbi:MAG: hypothetical protein LBQ54_03635 [Planctomycetaceae bacterium]|nr:hypothetical protein [Planctomycetaceae bacterium]
MKKNHCLRRGNARALHPGRLTLTSFGSPPNRKSFHLEAEGMRFSAY